MPKIIKNSYNKTEQIRNRVRIFRGVQSILKGERNIDKWNLNQNRFNDIPKSVHFSSCAPQKSLSDQLKQWVLEYHLTQRAVSKLLKILKSCGINRVPKDCRTLMSTPRVIKIENTAGGQLYYNGVTNGLNTIFSKLNSDISIEININADGLPLFKSSPIEFWPMLGNIRGDILIHMELYSTFRHFSSYLLNLHRNAGHQTVRYRHLVRRWETKKLE